MTDGKDGRLDQPPRNRRRATLVVFLLGVVVPAFLAFDQMFSIGLQNSNLFNVSNPNPIDAQTDPMIRATAVVLGASVIALAVFAMYERRHGLRRASSIVFLIVAIALLALNLFVLFG
ncbi:hypothetical protein [Agromyces ramosus]|uniref:Uncharacterized protein n=1 Tax=Agromyces ramosus TaxID=33879 RepID=A0ABU0RDB2_9MICO|nr:hypothetical protein [Agromyces ramosus]MDQ0896050.1 hypothetical protein [Agromyces ramosus]